jgi:hypothetical protein
MRKSFPIPIPKYKIGCLLTMKAGYPSEVLMSLGIKNKWENLQKGEPVVLIDCFINANKSVQLEVLDKSGKLVTLDLGQHFQNKTHFNLFMIHYFNIEET